MAVIGAIVFLNKKSSSLVLMPNTKSFAFLQITDMSFVKSNRPASSQFFFKMSLIQEVGYLDQGPTDPKKWDKKTGGAVIGLHPGDSQLIQDFWFSPPQEKQLSCLIR